MRMQYQFEIGIDQVLGSQVIVSPRRIGAPGRRQESREPRLRRLPIRPPERPAHGVGHRLRPAFVRRATPLQRSEQVRTWSQSRAHFLRQAKGRPQATQIFVGRSAFLHIFMTGPSFPDRATVDRSIWARRFLRADRSA